MNTSASPWGQVFEAWRNKNPKHPYVRMYDEATAGKDTISQAIVYRVAGVIGPALQSGPTPEISAKLALGCSLQDLGIPLSRREVSAFVKQSKHATPSEWLWETLKGEYPVLESAPRKPRSLGVVKWVRECMQSPERAASMVTPRERAFGGPRVLGRALDRLDEVSDADLCPSVWGTIENAVARAIREKWTGPDELIPSPPWEKDLPEGVHLLRHFSELWHEASVMSHCVASYARRVADQQCMIFSVVTKNQRSTVEVTRGKIVQQTGFANGPAPQVCKTLMEEALAIVNGVKSTAKEPAKRAPAKRAPAKKAPAKKAAEPKAAKAPAKATKKTTRKKATAEAMAPAE